MKMCPARAYQGRPRRREKLVIDVVIVALGTVTFWSWVLWMLT